MVTKLLAGVCAVALAAVSGSGRTEDSGARVHATTIRISAPVGLGVESGRASFSSAFASTRWRLVAAWSSDASRVQVGASFVSERLD
jgi:hypothetical protein